MKTKHIINIDKKEFSSIFTFLQNMLLAYAAYMLCRIVFICENWTLYHSAFTDGNFWTILKGSLLFDTSAILYTNSLYALMMLFPYDWREKRGWQATARWLFVGINSLAIIMNLCDAVYVQYTGRRTTTTVFSEFSNESNLGSIFGTELLCHWYLVLIGVAMIYGLYRFCKVKETIVANKRDSLDIPNANRSKKKRWSSILLHFTIFLLFIPLMLAGMRGGFTTAVRPITISNATQYVVHSGDAAIVLNTPFSLIRTIGKTAYPIPQYYSEGELEKIYSPVHNEPKMSNASPQNGEKSSLTNKNVVILIVESFGREFIKAYNQADPTGQAPSLEAGYEGYTPFVDSLYQHCLSFDYTFSNGRKSIDGMPSILSSIPMFVEPFVLTPASMNKVSGLAGELGQVGYTSAFFHGAENGSMGFQAFANSSGFQHYFGRDEFNADKRFQGDKDFDGTWAIWDEPFLQFYAQKMTEMKQPFVTAVFTASSHHPFAVPEQYKNVYPEEGGNELHKCIRYTDYSLRRFFETASQQPWFRNTIFILTSDHTNQPDHDEYKTDLGLFGSPILFYDPSGQLIPAGRRHCIAEQIDIMPSVLGLLGYNKPYVAFGQNLFATADEDTWAIHYNNGIYQLVKGNYMLQFDGDKAKSLYNIHKDWMLKENLLSAHPQIAEEMERLAKAVIQSYMTRMNKDQLTIKD